MLTVGDRVRIDATTEFGTVTAVHPHEVTVSIRVGNGHEERRYSHESLRLEPTMNEAPVSSTTERLRPARTLPAKAWLRLG